MKTLIKNGTIYLEGELCPLDLLIKDDQIQMLGQDLADEVSYDEAIDATGQLVTPGLIDPHVHYREPGQTEKETIHTGTKAAAHGGFTTVGAMPNVTPVPDTPERLDAMQSLNETNGIVHVKQFGTLTHGLQSEALVDFQSLKDHGAFAFSNDGSGVQTAGTMYDAMEQIAKLNLTLAAHVQDDSLSRKGVMTAGERQMELNLPGQLPESETSQLARDLLLAEATGCHYHVCHISTAASLDLVRWAKQRGIPVTCEVTPHHLLFSDQDVTSDNPLLKMNPPLRSEFDRQALLAGLIDGTINCIATDHAPHTIEEKSGSMQTATFGIIGSDFAFALLYTHLVETGLLPLTTLLEKMTTGPANAFQLTNVGQLLPGMPADIVLFDLNQSWTIERDTIYSKAMNTPHLGETVQGLTTHTIVSGKTVYTNQDGFLVQ
ncbi:MAG: dihydroorotase [Aerococcus sp.]|nr:dihydroorotase [Aerococcus sp.]